ncbi:HAUS augmin-like complex subunit 1 [Poeciliopsis prolifica]|uniref:HAUS augmin-like complex subunit 1 n=1 Tax=Poeciliopsis prolifica TaxID=188132 RepID=UPI002413A4F9|nr:HAUS augmin-like complex subunit 1 [Poeciliopsis prolifica]
MCEKLRKVNSWLEGVFGDQPVPSFEVNTRTLDILYQLAQSSEARCSDTALLIEDYKQKTSEYQADAAHLEDVLLHGVGLSGASLSEPTANYVSALVDNAMVLGVKDTSLTSFMPAINNLTDDLLEVEKSNRKLERELRALQKRLGSILVLRGNLQEDIDKTTKSQAVESAKEEERLLNMDFVTAKIKSSVSDSRDAEAQLVSRNMDKSITHPIVQLSEELRALQNEIIPLKKKLESYMDLSPSPSLAQVKIEEAKRELAALDSKLETMMDLNGFGCCAVLSLKIKFVSLPCRFLSSGVEQSLDTSTVSVSLTGVGPDLQSDMETEPLPWSGPQMLTREQFSHWGPQLG